MELPTRVYQKENNIGFFQILRQCLNDIYGSRYLARQLAERDIKAQYRQSYLGILWAFITPLATALVWIFLNLSGTIRVSDTNIPYPLYAFSGTLLWSIITAAVNNPSQNTNSSKGLLSKINFPKEALIMSGILKLLFDSSIKVLLLFLIIYMFGIDFHWSILLLPLVVFSAIIFGVMIGLFLTPISLLYTDVGKIVSMGFSFLMYVTPVVYAIPKEEGIMKTIMEVNPVTPIILTCREIITGGGNEHMLYYFSIVFLSIPLFLVGLVLYRISIPIIVERA